MKDILLTYKLYLQTLLNVRDHGNKYGDENILPILENDLRKALVKKNEFKNYKK